MSDKDIVVIEGMMLSVQAVLKEASARLSCSGGVVGSPQDQARIELATAAQAIEMARFWVAKINVCVGSDPCPRCNKDRNAMTPAVRSFHPVAC